MIITLPWPSRDLFPNSAYRKGGFHPRITAAANYKDDAYLAALSAGVQPEILQSYVVSIDFYPPSNRGDFDGMISAIKAGIDGIFQAIGQDDHAIREGYFRIHLKDNDPRVVIALEPLIR